MSDNGNGFSEGVQLWMRFAAVHEQLSVSCVTPERGAARRTTEHATSRAPMARRCVLVTFPSKRPSKRPLEGLAENIVKVVSPDCRHAHHEGR